MSKDTISIIQPMKRAEMVFCMYRYLILCDLRIRFGLSDENDERARQDGYVFCMMEAFGSSDDDNDIEEAFKNKRTWIAIVDDFMEEHEELIDVKPDNLDDTEKFHVFLKTADQLEEKLKQFILENWDRVFESLKYI